MRYECLHTKLTTYTLTIKKYLKDSERLPKYGRCITFAQT